MEFTALLVCSRVLGWNARDEVRSARIEQDALIHVSQGVPLSWQACKTFTGLETAKSVATIPAAMKSQVSLNCLMARSMTLISETTTTRRTNIEIQHIPRLHEVMDAADYVN